MKEGSKTLESQIIKSANLMRRNRIGNRVYVSTQPDSIQTCSSQFQSEAANLLLHANGVSGYRAVDKGVRLDPNGKPVLVVTELVRFRNGTS